MSNDGRKENWSGMAQLVVCGKEWCVCVHSNVRAELVCLPKVQEGLEAEDKGV
jgi:hypothetical protein